MDLDIPFSWVEAPVHLLFYGSVGVAVAVSEMVGVLWVETEVSYVSLVSQLLPHQCLPDWQVSMAARKTNCPSPHFLHHWKTVVVKTGKCMYVCKMGLWKNEHFKNKLIYLEEHFVSTFGCMCIVQASVTTGKFQTSKLQSFIHFF